MTRIADLVSRYAMSAGMAWQLEELAALLSNDPLAPTSITDPHRVLEDHVADSLVALEVDGVRRAGAIADLGSGAGLPALPLAIALPGAQVTALESNGRKAEFVARAAAACGVKNVTVAAVRVEELAGGRGSFDLVTARALASLPVVAEYAAPLLRIGGALVAWRGRIDPGEEPGDRAAAAELGLRYQEPRRVKPYPGALNRHLHVLVKAGPTPVRFPRRPGMARKRPLGAS